MRQKISASVDVWLSGGQADGPDYDIQANQEQGHLQSSAQDALQGPPREPRHGHIEGEPDALG